MTNSLETAREVIDALGGPTAVGRMTGDSPQAVCNWGKKGRLQPETYVVLSAALLKRGLSAPTRLWGMRELTTVIL